jgi:hypothetical protein
MRMPLSILMGCLASANPAFCTTIATNSPPWDGISTEPLWGGGINYVPTFGQVLTVPAADTFLSKFSIRLALFPTPRNFSAQILAWNQGAFKPIGSALYNQDLALTAQQFGTYQAVSFAPMVQLNPGSK